MAAAMTRQEDDIAPAQLAGKQIVRRRTKRRFNLHPFLFGEAFNVIQAAAPDDANAVLRHARGYRGGSVECRVSRRSERNHCPFSRMQPEMKFRVRILPGD